MKVIREDEVCGSCIDYCQSIPLEELAEGLVKPHLYDYSREENGKYIQGLTDDYKSIPPRCDVMDVASGYNQALSDFLKAIKEYKGGEK